MTFSPSAQQQNIIDFLAQNPQSSLIIEASPGSGKTTTLVMCVNQLGHAPHEVKALAFQAKNKAALENALPNGFKECASTIHSLGRRILSGVSDNRIDVQSGKYRNLAYDLGFLTPRRRTKSSVDLVYRNALSSTATRDLFSAMSLLRSNCCDLQDIEQINKMLPEVVSLHSLTGILESAIVADAIYDLYDEGHHLFNKRGIIDFDDMIAYPCEMELLGRLQFGTVLVDEAQDLSPLKAKFVFGLSQRFIFVGDSKQAIFGFAGAQADSMERIADELDTFTRFATRTLTTSYRMGSAITSFVNTVFPEFDSIVPGNPSTGNARVYTAADFMESVCAGDIAVARTNAQLVESCLKLTSQGVPSIILGGGIQTRLVDALEQSMEFASNAEMTLQDQGTHWTPISVGKLCIQSWKLKRIEACEDAGSGEIIEDLTACVEMFLDQVELPLFDDRTPMGEKMTVLIDEFKKLLRKSFADKDQISPRHVTLMTIHKSKGLEANTVWVFGNKLPMSRESMTEEELREERRILYVALTRAKSNLNIVGKPYWAKSLTAASCEA